MGKKEDKFYVSNKSLFAVYISWYKDIADAKALGQEEPQMPDEIVDAIIKICTRLSYRPNFFNYSYKQDMIGDAIEKNFRVAKNFDPARSENPFAYITTIAWNCFISRIAVEKKQTYIKAKLVTELPMDALIEVDANDEESRGLQQQYIEYLREHSYIVHHIDEKKKRPKLAEETPLELAMDRDLADE